MTCGARASTSPPAKTPREAFEAAVGFAREYSRAVLSGATFGLSRRYRYLLWRRWDEGLPVVGFVMLNPSVADESADDPTIRRCLGFARDWGFGGLVVANLFGLRATDSAVLRRDADPVGPENEGYLAGLPGACGMVVAAWGGRGSLLGRSAKVRGMLAALGPVHVLGFTASGEPVHPLYVRRSVVPVVWDGGVGGCG